MVESSIEPLLAAKLAEINCSQLEPILVKLGCYSAEEAKALSDDALEAEGVTLVQRCLLAEAAAEISGTEASAPRASYKRGGSGIKKSSSLLKKPSEMGVKQPDAAVLAEGQPRDLGSSAPSRKWTSFRKRSVQQTSARNSAASSFVLHPPRTRSADVPWVRANTLQRAVELIENGKVAVRCGGADFYKPTMTESGPQDYEPQSSEDSVGICFISKALQQSRTLRHLDLSGCELSKTSSDELAQALKVNRSLWHLDLSGSLIGPAGARALAEVLKSNRSIRHLSLRDNALGTEGADAVAEILRMNGSIQHLDLSHNELGAEGGRKIAEALRPNQTLVHLNLGYNGIGAEGGCAIAVALCSKGHVKHLDLTHNDIGSEGGRAIAKAIQGNPNYTLQSLELKGNRLDKPDMRAISNAFRLNRTNCFQRPSPYY